MGSIQTKNRKLVRDTDASEQEESDPNKIKAKFDKTVKAVRQKNTKRVDVGDELESIIRDTSENKTTAISHLQKFMAVALGKDTSDGASADVSQDITRVIDKHGKVATFFEGESILCSGEDSCGILIIVSGTADVVTKDDSLVINQLSSGDVFGEVSTLFDVPCTAHVKAKTDVVTVVIGPEEACELFEGHEENLDIIDTFIKHRYLPIGEGIDAPRTYRRMALRFLKHVPMFHSWSTNALKDLILSFDRQVVTLYPANATLVSIDDPVVSMFIVIRGTLLVKGGDGFCKTIEVSMYSKPFIYGNMCLVANDQVSLVNITASKNCLVMVIENNWIYNVINKDRHKSEDIEGKGDAFVGFQQRLGYRRTEFGTDLEFDVLYHYASKAVLYKRSDPETIQSKILNSVFEDFNEGEIVILGVERGSYESVMVIHGRIFLTKTNRTNNKTVSFKTDKEIFEEHSNNSPNAAIEEENETPTDNDRTKALAGSIDNTGDDGRIFEQGWVIDLSLIDLTQLSLKSLGRSLVGKVRTSDCLKISTDSTPNIKFNDMDAADTVNVQSGVQSDIVADESEKLSVPADTLEFV